MGPNKVGGGGVIYFSLQKGALIGEGKLARESGGDLIEKLRYSESQSHTEHRHCGTI